jgi:hypothetical protein
MKPAEYFREFFYPLTHLAPLVSIMTLGLMVAFAVQLAWIALTTNFWPALGLSIALALVATAATVRYPLLLIEARALGIEPRVPGVESFSYLSDWWSLFPAVHALKWIALVWYAEDIAGEFGVIVAALVAMAFQPAELLVLTLTRSPLESLNPLTLLRLIHRILPVYWLVPATFLFAAMLQALIPGWPLWLTVLANFFLCFCVYSVFGAMIRPYSLFDAVGIAPPVEADERKIAKYVERERGRVLNHAYGFASRGNANGALRQIARWLEEDPYPGDAWPWFFNAMLNWEDSYPALKLAQDYLDLLLQSGDTRGAVKLLLRCKHANEEFRPHAGSRDAAIAAAESVGHGDLVDWLRRR